MAWLALRTQDGARPLSREEFGDFTFDGAAFRLVPPAERHLEAGLQRYNWRGMDSQHADNRALRAAMQSHVPLSWLFGVGQAHYQPVYPVDLLREEPASTGSSSYPKPFAGATLNYSTTRTSWASARTSSFRSAPTSWPNGTVPCCATDCRAGTVRGSWRRLCI